MTGNWSFPDFCLSGHQINFSPLVLLLELMELAAHNLSVSSSHTPAHEHTFPVGSNWLTQHLEGGAPKNNNEYSPLARDGKYPLSQPAPSNPDHPNSDFKF